MAISRAQQLKELEPGLHALFGEAYKAYENEHLPLYDTENSNRAWEEDVKVSGFGAGVVKPEGEGIMYDNAQELWTARYNHETVALGYSITEEAMDDNLYVNLSRRYTKSLARGMAYTKQVKAVVPFNDGFTTYNTGDGVTFFSTAHPMIVGTNANRPTVAVDLNETSLEQAVIDIAAWKDERGLLIAAKPRKLMIAPANMFVVTRLLETQQRPGTADNDVNALVNNGAIPEGWFINHYFTDADAWFLKTDIPDGARHFVRKAISTKMDGDFETGNVKYKSWERYSFGISDPLSYYGSPGI